MILYLKNNGKWRKYDIATVNSIEKRYGKTYTGQRE